MYIYYRVVFQLAGAEKIYEYYSSVMLQVFK